MRVFFISTFVGTALPSVGGDAVRALSLRRHAVPGATAVASVAMDRALGVVAILLLGLASLVAFTAPVPRGVFVILVLGGLAGLGLALVIFSDAVARSPAAWRPASRARGSAACHKPARGGALSASSASWRR
jgi:hypothetical protein